MNEASRECAAYFQRTPAFARVLEGMCAKYRSYGGPSGTVVLADATEEECSALRGLFGRTFRPPVRVRTAEFEKALQETPFRGAVLQEVLELWSGEKLQTRKQEKEERDARLERILAEAAPEADSAGAAWLESLGSSRSRGRQLIVRTLPEGDAPVSAALQQVLRCGRWLSEHEGRQVRLAVLSAAATTDPHALDSGTLAGKLLVDLLACGRGVPVPEGAEERELLFFQYGILCDSISSTVTQTGLMLLDGEGEHPAWKALRLRRELCTLTPSNLSGLAGAESPSGKAFIVENQMVFSQLCDHAEQFHSPLICTSGQPSVAALRLLDLLAASGTRMYYSGDFDGKGLSIASQLAERYPGVLTPWRMGPEDYRRCRSSVELSEESRQLLRGRLCTSLQETAQAVEEGKTAGYQELLLPELLSDLTRDQGEVPA